VGQWLYEVTSLTKWPSEITDTLLRHLHKSLKLMDSESFCKPCPENQMVSTFLEVCILHTENPPLLRQGSIYSFLTGSVQPL